MMCNYSKGHNKFLFPATAKAIYGKRLQGRRKFPMSLTIKSGQYIQTGQKTACGKDERE